MIKNKNIRKKEVANNSFALLLIVIFCAALSFGLSYFIFNAFPILILLGISLFIYYKSENAKSLILLIQIPIVIAFDYFIGFPSIFKLYYICVSGLLFELFLYKVKVKTNFIWFIYNALGVTFFILIIVLTNKYWYDANDFLVFISFTLSFLPMVFLMGLSSTIIIEKLKENIE